MIILSTQERKYETKTFNENFAKKVRTCRLPFPETWSLNSPISIIFSLATGSKAQSNSPFLKTRDLSPRFMVETGFNSHTRKRGSTANVTYFPEGCITLQSTVSSSGVIRSRNLASYILEGRRHTPNKVDIFLWYKITNVLCIHAETLGRACRLGFAFIYLKKQICWDCKNSCNFW